MDQVNQSAERAPKPLLGRTAIVTGGSRGIGRATAARLADAGAQVVVQYVTHREEAEASARACATRSGQPAVAVQADVAREDDVQRLFMESSQLGIPSILINNAGVAHYSLVQDTTLAQWHRVLDVNLTSMFLCTKAFLPYCQYSRDVRILNISSTHGLQGAAMEAAYAAAKGGVIAWTKSLAKELAPSGVTVNAIAPGIIDTDMLQGFDATDLARFIEQTPIGRLGTPEDIAELALFLCLPTAGFITGQVISPNGGIYT